MAKRRRFTPKFKAEVVLEALRGETSQAELCRRYNLSENQPNQHQWLAMKLEKLVEVFRPRIENLSDEFLKSSRRDADDLRHPRTRRTGFGLGASACGDISQSKSCSVLGWQECTR